jgi:hypothetical protein
MLWRRQLSVVQVDPRRSAGLAGSMGGLDEARELFAETLLGRGLGLGFLGGGGRWGELKTPEACEVGVREGYVVEVQAHRFCGAE